MSNTITTACPSCQTPLQIRGEYAGKSLNCPQCKAEFIVPLVQAVPQGNPYQSPRSKAKQSGTKTIVVAAIVGGVVMALVGFLSSQFWPVFGLGWHIAMSKPFSEIRMAQVPIHLFAFMPLGLLFGGFIGWLMQRDR